MSATFVVRFPFTVNIISGRYKSIWIGTIGFSFTIWHIRGEKCTVNLCDYFTTSWGGFESDHQVREWETSFHTDHITLWSLVRGTNCFCYWLESLWASLDRWLAVSLYIRCWPLPHADYHCFLNDYPTCVIKYHSWLCNYYRGMHDCLLMAQLSQVLSPLQVGLFFHVLFITSREGCYIKS